MDTGQAEKLLVRSPQYRNLAKGRFPLSIGSDWTFFQLVSSTPPDQKNESRFKLEQKIGTESPCAG